jgi:hypothetical protein
MLHARLLPIRLREKLLRRFGKTPEEIRKTFNIKNDLTEEEEAQVCKENQ